jgi:hypothetical protein
MVMLKKRLALGSRGLRRASTLNLAIVGLYVVILGTIGLISASAAATVRPSNVGASPSKAPKGGAISVWFTAPSSASGTVGEIVVTGAIGDYGTATLIDKDGNVDVKGDYMKVALQKGGFEINGRAFVNNVVEISYTKATCSVVGGGSGPVTLFNGSGAYAGLSATLRFTESAAAILSRTNNGQCNTSSNAAPVVLWGSITGSGTVKYSG